MKRTRDILEGTELTSIRGRSHGNFVQGQKHWQVPMHLCKAFLPQAAGDGRY